MASRTERTVLHDMGQDAASQAQIIDDALDLAERLVAAAEAYRVDLGDLGRPAPPPARGHDRRERRRRVAA